MRTAPFPPAQSRLLAQRDIVGSTLLTLGRRQKLQAPPQQRRRHAAESRPHAARYFRPGGALSSAETGAGTQGSAAGGSSPLGRWLGRFPLVPEEPELEACPRRPLVNQAVWTALGSSFMGQFCSGAKR